MASQAPQPVCEGVFAINKPLNISSAQVIRDAQAQFKDSKFFKPWLDREQKRKDDESHNQRQKRRSWKQRQPMQVKIGHGGTLDPMATGVLILGVGSGTKSLSRFLECTKSYEAVVLFGAATDSYDSVGKIVGRKSYGHVTRDLVEDALGKLRGKIMQRPPIFSALRIQGKRLYEYAREGKEVPVEIEERPVEVESLEMTEWMEGGTHPYNWPEQEAEKEEKEVVEQVLHLEGGSGTKRKRDEDVINGDAQEKEDNSSHKRSKSSTEPIAPNSGQEPVNGASDQLLTTTDHASDSTTAEASCPAPACRLRMTVTSGFYVRSLCHDLGAAVDSLGFMASLVRTRQGDFKLGRNVLEYDDLSKGEDVWGPKIGEMLRDWNEREKDEDGGADVDKDLERVMQGPREAKLRVANPDNGSQ